jgi:hypothetical protein
LNIVHKDITKFYNKIKEANKDDMISLSIFFLAEFEKEKEKSEYNLFLDYLPKCLNEHPLFYNEEKIKYLKGSYLFYKLSIWKEQLKSEYESLIKIDIVNEFKLKEFNLEKYIFFRVLVWSRNFDTKMKLNNENDLDIYKDKYKDKDNYIDNNIYKDKDNSIDINLNDSGNKYIEISSLIPVADMFNTDPNNINTDWFFEESTGKFILKAIKEIKKDQEVNYYF